MRAVNLLPEEFRPRTSATTRSGGAYVVLGVLGAALLAVVVYVLTLNQVGSHEDAIAEAKNESAAAEARSQALQPVADFLKVKQQREDSVKALAGRRFDWERLVLELSRVMPRGVYLLSTTTSLTGSTTGASGSPGAAAAPAPSASGAASAEPPKMTLVGCAPSQDALAATLVRLRRLHGAADVTLSKSADDAGKGASGSSASSASSAAAPATGGETGKCARREYEFDASVVFEPVAVASAKRDDKVPASLGGGQ